MRELCHENEKSPSKVDEFTLSSGKAMSAESSQPTPILLPQAGNSMEEGRILAWRVKPGDRVKAGDVLFDLETDKATLEVEAEVAGRLSLILVKEGQTAAVKTPVAYFGEDDAQVAALVGQVKPKSEEEKPLVMFSQEPAAVKPAVSDLFAPSRQRVSPLARKAANEKGVELRSIAGTGPDGRVLLKDVLAAAQAPSTPIQPIKPIAGGERRPMTKMRKAIAKNLSISKQTLPHWYLKLTIEADALMSFYKKEKSLYPCSVNDVIVFAVSRALLEFPVFLDQVDGDDLVRRDAINIGLAVGLEAGLVVPVLKNADSLSLKGIAAETRRLIEAAKVGKVEGMGEGVFTISNLGMFGVEEFSAIINPPESGILAVGAAREEVIVKDGAMRPGRRMTLTLSADHRTIDGTTGAQFMARLKALLENPASIGGA
jgi:pyruvate dehydrogenase E2 component (dihydrolipoamide acetyltransferase)